VSDSKLHASLAGDMGWAGEMYHGLFHQDVPNYHLQSQESPCASRTYVERLRWVWFPASRTIRPHAKARSGAMALRSIQAFFVVALLHLQGQWV
jgi:hypothetical protein